MISDSYGPRSINQWALDKRNPWPSRPGVPCSIAFPYDLADDTKPCCSDVRHTPVKMSRAPFSRRESYAFSATILTFLASGVLAAYPSPASTCSSTSATSWEIKNFAVDTNSKFYYGKGTIGKASFSIKNLVNGYEFSCTQGSGRDVASPNFSLQDNKVWYSCNAYCYGPETNPPLDTSFSFDIDAKSLSVSQKWSCAGNSSATSG